MKIIVGADHGAIELREAIIEYLNQQPNVEVLDKGTFSSESVDYPDIADLVTESILSNEGELGILCCGTGIGISIRANRHKGIRAALVYDEFTAKMAKQHNNANIVCFGGRTTEIDMVKKCLDSWLTETYEGGRHNRRIEKLDK